MAESEEHLIKPGRKWEIALFQPEDAPGIACLFRKVYGDGYPMKTFADPERLIAENAARRTISVVARTPEGKIVGHAALYHSAPFEGLFELGAEVVDPHCRGGLLAFRLVEHGLTVVARQFEIAAVFGESVCNHIITQKFAVRLKFEPCALEVDLMPTEAYTQEASASGRVATLLTFNILADKPQAIHVPGVYEELLRLVYCGLGQENRFVPAAGDLPAGTKTRVAVEIFDYAGVARFAVHEAGAEFASVFDEQEQAARNRGTIVHQVWLKLSWPWVGRVVALLRSRGYFIGGVLPRWFDVDGLLMQKVFGLPHWDGIHLFADKAVRILDMVKADWEEAQGRS